MIHMEKLFYIRALRVVQKNGQEVCHTTLKI